MIRIERITPRNGVTETPHQTHRGFELVDGKISSNKHYVANSTFVRSIEEAAYLVEKGYSIRMSAPGKRPSLIAPASLKISKS